MATSECTPLSPVATNRPASDERTKDDTPARNPQQQAAADDAGDAWTSFLQTRIGLRKAPVNDDTDSEGDDEDDEDGDRMDFDILLMRKFFTRWVKKARLQASACDPTTDPALSVDWTRTIAPVLEGRIKMVQ
jgi:5'-nucleotidase